MSSKIFFILLLLCVPLASNATPKPYISSVLPIKYEKNGKSYLSDFGKKNYKSLKLALKKTPQMLIGSYLIAICVNKVLISAMDEVTYAEMQGIENTYEDMAISKPMKIMIINPILEELLFRMTMIPFIQTKEQNNFYKFQNYFMKLYSSILFAKIHWDNPHPGKIVQTIGAGTTGIMYYNLLEEDITIGGAKTATIFAHIINNSLIMLTILSVQQI